MSSCIIHIGMHKTGSTSIQWSLHNVQDKYFTYANLGDDPNHSYAIHDLFTDESELGFFDAKPDQPRVDRHRAALLQAISSNGARTMIISGEQISSMHPAALARLKDFLTVHFNQVRIVAYVRPPASYLASAFQQRLKVRSPTFEPLRLYRSFKNTFQKFDDIFGTNNVELWKFDSTRLLNNCVVSDFCQRLGISLPADRIRTENESISRQFVGLLYVYRKFAPDLAASLHVREVESLNHKLSMIWNDKFVLAPELIQTIHVHHATDIAWMEARLDQSLQESPRTAQKYAIQSEADLIDTAPDTIKQLRALLGKHEPYRPQENTPAHVAQLFHQLRNLHASPSPVGRWKSYKAKFKALLQRSPRQV